MKISYNAPVTLTFSLICVAVFFIPLLSTNLVNGEPTGPLGHFFILGNLSNPNDYPSLFLYIFGHASMEHIMGNLTFILLLGPIIEEKYGSNNLSIMVIVTALVTGVLNVVFFHTGLLGASGIVFLFIILASFGNAKKGIPLTFILIALLFVGKEVMNSMESNQISEFAHIIGGACGSLFGFSGLISKKETSYNEYDY